MTNPVQSIEIGPLLCDALGIDIKCVTTISIDLNACDIVRVIIGKAVTQEEMNSVVEILKEYHLVKNDTTPFITGKDPIQTFE